MILELNLAVLRVQVNTLDSANGRPDKRPKQTTLRVEPGLGGKQMKANDALADGMISAGEFLSSLQ